MPDCLKQGVLKCHLYDPDLNPGYAQLASHFATAVVPARPSHPKDKALAEGAVKILMRYLRFRYRRTRFISLSQINQAIAECIEHINARRHTRFGVSRRERFESVERAALKPLPVQDVDVGEWKDATLHADCYVLVEAVLYSAPHIHRHKKLRIKLTENSIEIFLNLRAPGDPPAQPPPRWAAHLQRRALPARKPSVLRGDAAEAAVAIALHPPRVEPLAGRHVQR